MSRCYKNEIHVLKLLNRYKKSYRTKLLISLKHLPYYRQMKTQLMLPTLKYRCLRGDMIVHNLYDLEAAVKLNFNTSSTTRGKKYKLQKSSMTCHYVIIT